MEERFIMSAASRVLLYGEAVCGTVATIARTPSVVVHGQGM
jgi:hypothetical protein